MNRTAFILTTLLILSCENPQPKMMENDFSKLKNIPQHKWDTLADKKIFFGHVSVGYNIIEGIKDLMQNYPEIKLNIIETDNPSDFSKPLFAHFRIGKNMDPYSKIKDFEQYIANGIGEKTDIAFFKFCYVDFLDKINIQYLFENYKNTFSRLKVKYPATTFLHVTAPLTIEDAGIKRWINAGKNLIKKIIGKTVYNKSTRNKFNDLLRDEYKGKDPIFDLAEIESTHLDGKRITQTKGGKMIFAMDPSYTDDGGHLNELGRKIVAEKLLFYLVNLSR